MAATFSGLVPAGDLMPVSPGRSLDEDPAGLDDRTLPGIAGSLPRASERQALRAGTDAPRPRGDLAAGPGPALPNQPEAWNIAGPWDHDLARHRRPPRC